MIPSNCIIAQYKVRVLPSESWLSPATGDRPNFSNPQGRDIMSVKDKPSKLMKFSTVPKNQHEINGYNAENQTLLKYEIALHLCSEKKKNKKKNHYDVASLEIRTAKHSVSKLREVSQPVRM